MQHSKWLVIAIISGITFTWGAATIKFRIFPYQQIKALKHVIYPDKNMPSYYFYRKSLFELFSNKADIIMIGDSITDYALWEEFFDYAKIANRGIDGDTTEGVLQRLDSVFSLQAEKAFVMIGVNDFRGNRTVQEVFQNYQAIVGELIEHDIQPYIQSTLLVGKQRRILNARIAELNALLLNWCAETGITFIDLNAELSKDDLLRPEFTHDGIHLNAKGYKVWVDQIKQYVKE